MQRRVPDLVCKQNDASVGCKMHFAEDGARHSWAAALLWPPPPPVTLCRPLDGLGGFCGCEIQQFCSLGRCATQVNLQQFVKGTHGFPIQWCKLNLRHSVRSYGCWGTGRVYGEDSGRFYDWFSSINLNNGCGKTHSFTQNASNLACNTVPVQESYECRSRLLYENFL